MWDCQCCFYRLGLFVELAICACGYLPPPCRPILLSLFYLIALLLTAWWGDAFGPACDVMCIDGPTSFGYGPPAVVTLLGCIFWLCADIWKVGGLGFFYWGVWSEPCPELNTMLRPPMTPELLANSLRTDFGCYGY